MVFRLIRAANGDEITLVNLSFTLRGYNVCFAVPDDESGLGIGDHLNAIDSFTDRADSHVGRADLNIRLVILRDAVADVSAR